MIHSGNPEASSAYPLRAALRRENMPWNQWLINGESRRHRYGPKIAWDQRIAQGTTMEAQKTAIEAIVVLTGCDRALVEAFIRKFYLAGVKDPKRLTFKGLQAVARN
jgi:hypothetical protein